MTEAEIKEILSGEFTIEIRNFEKWNPPLRKKGVRRDWFKLSTNFYMDPKVAKLTEVERWFWVVLLAVRATSDRGLHDVTLSYFQGRLGVRGRSPRGLLVKLLKSGLIEVRQSPHREDKIREDKIRKEERLKDPADPVHPPKDSSPPEKENTPKEKDPIPDLLPIWNENRGTLSEATAMSDHRKRAWKGRWNDKPDLDYWKQVVLRMSKSAFCRGEVNNWKATIDFFLRPETHIKVMEGTYDGTKAQKTPNKATGNQALWDKVERGEI